jgi:hypothetical protein
MENYIAFSTILQWYVTSSCPCAVMIQITLPGWTGVACLRSVSSYGYLAGTFRGRSSRLCVCSLESSFVSSPLLDSPSIAPGKGAKIAPQVGNDTSPLLLGSSKVALG